MQVATLRRPAGVSARKPVRMGPQDEKMTKKSPLDFPNVRLSVQLLITTSPA
jgi:hypothetical protein